MPSFPSRTRAPGRAERGEAAGGGGGAACAGAPSTVFPFAALGPSLDLRGELGGNLAVTLRGVVGLNVLRPPNTDEAWSGRIELALSWGLR